MNYTLVFPAESFGGPGRRASRQQVTVRQPEHDRDRAFAPRASYPNQPVTISALVPIYLNPPTPVSGAPNFFVAKSTIERDRAAYSL